MKNNYRNNLKLSVILICGGLLSGCLGGSGGGSSDAASPAGSGASLSGTAAVGSGISGATITAICADDSGFSETVTTNADGSWSGVINSSSVLPCALQLSGGTPAITLHSLATQPGNVNITPLTDLALALQINLLSGQSLGDWFAAPNTGSSELNSLNSSLSDAADTLRDAMLAANFSLPGSWTAGSTAPFTTPFSANPSSDPYDQLLESLARAISGNVNLADYPALLDSLVAGAPLPTAPSQNSGGTSPATINPSLVGSKTLVFKAGSGEGCGSICAFTEAQEVTVVIGADNSLNVNGKVLTNPFNRLFSGTPHLPEIIWKDGDIEYALSDNESGLFSEINVGDGARPEGPFGLPAYLGQLRENIANTPASARIGPLAGNYSPVIVAKSSRYSGNSPLLLGEEIEVFVYSDGVVNIDGYEFDPADPTYQFFDATTSSASPELSYEGTIEEATDITLSLAIIIDPSDGQPVAWRLTRLTKLGPGTYSSSTLDLEQRPVPQEVVDFYTDLQALSPITLTSVVDDTSFSSGFGLCDQVVLTIEGDGSPASPWTYDLNPPGATTPGPAVGQFGFDIYRRSYARYTEETGARRLALRLRNRDLVLADDGQVDLVIRAYGGVLKDRATTELSQISAAGCSQP